MVSSLLVFLQQQNQEQLNAFNWCQIIGLDSVGAKLQNSLAHIEAF